MKNLLIGILAGVWLVGCGDRAADTSQPQEHETSEVAAVRDMFDVPYLMRELDNGLRVIVVRTDYPDIVSLQIPVQTGSRNEVEPGKSGFAHFFEHMMFRGTEKYPKALYTDILKKAGAESNAYTTDDYTNYHITFTKPDLEKMIELEADRFMNLEYSESDFRTEALAVKGEYLKNYSNPLLKAYERLRALGFERHPYRHTTMGFIEDIDAMPDQMAYSQEFFDRWYRPEHTSIVIVGDVDPEQTYRLVDKYWSDWERGSYVAEIPPEGPADGPRYEHIRWEGETQPWLLIAYRGPAYEPTEKDMPAMDLVASVYFSDSSDLYQEMVIEEQWVDQLAFDFTDNKDPNLLLIYARLTDDSHAADVEQAIGRTFARARTELIDNKKLEDTKKRLRYSFASGLDSSASIARILASYVQFKRTPETINEVYRTYAGLTAADVRDRANRYFADDARVTVSLSSAAEMPGVDGTWSVDSIVAEKGMQDAPLANTESQQQVADESFAHSGDAVAVEIVAQPSVRSPLVDVAIIVHAGAGMDPAGKKGLASLTAAMLTDGGSAAYPIEQINDAMYTIASGFDAQVDKEMTRLSGQVHRDNLDTWYRFARSQLLNPGWHQKDFERVAMQLRNAVRTGLVANNDEELGKEVLYSSIYGPAHPYGSPNLGYSGNIDKLTLDDVREFYEKYYTVGNITIGLSGGYPESFATRLSDDLQVLPAGERTQLEVPHVTRPEGSKAVIVAKETPAVAVSLGFPIELKRGDPDWVALWLVRSYLGEHRSSNSYLYKRIREARGMNYGDYAYIEYFPRGMFQFQPDANLGRQQQIFQVWIRPLRSNNDAHFATRVAQFEIDRLVNSGMSESDFEATRAYLAKNVSLLMDSQSRQLGYALDSRYYEIGNFADYVRDGLENLTLADVNRVMRENLDMDNVRYVFVTRDAEDLRQRLVDNTASPMRYDADMPAGLLEEDELIQSVPLGLGEGDVAVVPEASVFEQGL